ncbi:MAG: integration host factor, actinobacterial type [Actinomycetes bacterium]
MPVPALTHDQRVAASAKAVHIRTKRAQVKRQLKDATISWRDLLAVADVDEIVAGMKVVAALESMPGIGRIKAAAIMDKCGVAHSRRLRGLGPHQVASLCDVLDSRAR